MEVSMAPEFTTDGHLIGEDGWLMPRDALEFWERYRHKIKMFARMLKGDEEIGEIEQRVWLKLFRYPGENCRYPEANDYIEYINKAFAATGDKIRYATMLAYIKTIVWGAVYGYYKPCDALECHANVSLTSVLSADDNGENSQYEPEELLLEHRNRLYEPMRNDPDRVLYFKEFLTFVEQREPELLPFIQTVEDSSLYQTNSVKRARLLALAEEFEGKQPTGRKNWYIRRDSVKFRNIPASTYRPVIRTTEHVLSLIAGNPLGLTMKEVAAHIGRPLNRVSNVGTQLVASGHLARTGQYRDGARVLIRTSLPYVYVPKRRGKKINEHLLARAANNQG